MNLTKNFTEAEFRCPRSQEAKMDAEFMRQLQILRDRFGKPMVLTSGYRSPEYNAQVSSTGTTGPHTTGKAADFLVSGEDAYTLVWMALEQGFSGVGINQRGPHDKRFVHLDLLEAPEYPRPRIWSY